MTARAESIHAPLRRLLEVRGPAKGGWVGRVHAVYPKAVYVRLGGELACLVAPGAGDGPGQVVLAGPEAPGDLGWTPGAAVRQADGRLEVPGGRAVDWSGAREWRPPPPGCPLEVGPSPAPALRAARGWLGAALAGRAGGEGLLPVVLGLPGPGEPAGRGSGGAAGPVPGARFRHALAARAGPGIRALAAALSTGGAPAGRVRAAVAGLVGLGPGLTPSGDDLLGGTVCTLRRAGHPAAGPLAAALLEAVARGATAEVSAHFLRWATRGVAWEPGIALVDGLLRGAAAGPAGRELDGVLDAVLARGETSGRDWAAGVLLALDVMPGTGA